MTRPANSLPLSWSIALRASSSVAISTNPIAFDVRGVPPMTTSQLMTRPAPSNSLCNSESVVLVGSGGHGASLTYLFSFIRRSMGNWALLGYGVFTPLCADDVPHRLWR